MTESENDAEDEARYEAEYRAAGEAAREIVTLMKMAEGQGYDDPAHMGGIVREVMRGYQSRQAWRLVEVIARGVAGTFADLDEWSTHVLDALAEGDSGETS